MNYPHNNLLVYNAAFGCDFNPTSKSLEARNLMQKKINKLLSELCTGWGFCIPTEEATKILEQENIEADQFACAILTAEGMNPEIEVEWRRKIRNRFIEFYGSRFS